MVDLDERLSAAVPAPMPTDAPVAIEVRGLGVQYSLRFTRKTTLHRSFVNLFRRQPADRFWALRDVDFRLVHGESLGGHRPERGGQEHAPPGPRRDHHAIGGRGGGRWPDLEPADARCRLRPGAIRARQHPPCRRIPRPRPGADAPDHAGHHRVRRHRSVHRGADQDLLVRHARPPGLRDRDLGRPGHPAARRGARTGDQSFRTKSKQRVLDLVRAPRGSYS